MTADTLHKKTEPAIKFNDVAINEPIPSGREIIFAIRKDALFAADLLLRKLAATKKVINGEIPLAETVSATYREWGHSVLRSFARHLDYAQYGKNAEGLRIMFFDAEELGVHTRQNAYSLAEAKTGKDTPPLLISLDDMIKKPDDTKFPEIAFSRLFTLEGEEKDYVARPGHKPVDEQIKDIAKLAKDIAEKTGKKPAIVLLEDNVRRSKMMNWIINKMDDHGVFEYAELAGISTSFCNATEAELANIKFRGQQVPVSAVKSCHADSVIDVATTRDLMFDGFVTEHEGKIGRLPGIFMDVAKRFKIDPKRADEFRREILEANIKFCQSIEKSFGEKPLLSWFDGGPIIASIQKIPLDMPMEEVMRRELSKIPGGVNASNDAKIHEAHTAAGVVRPLRQCFRPG